jgi:hypothetical protein
MHAAGQTRELCRACSSLAQLVDSQTLVSRDSKGGASQARAAGSQTNSTVKSTICSVSLLASTTPRILGRTRGRVNEKHAASKYQDSCSSLVNGSRARAAPSFSNQPLCPGQVLRRVLQSACRFSIQRRLGKLDRHRIPLQVEHLFRSVVDASRRVSRGCGTQRGQRS